MNKLGITFYYTPIKRLIKTFYLDMIYWCKKKKKGNDLFLLLYSDCLSIKKIKPVTSFGVGRVGFAPLPPL